MKRLLILSLLVASLALPAGASARALDFLGPVDEGGYVGFDLKNPAHGPTKVVHFAWGKGIPISCDDGEWAEGGGTLDHAIPFYDNTHFKLDSQLVHETTKITGVRKSKHKFEGTLVWKADEVLDHPNCKTGKLHWQASDEL